MADNLLCCDCKNCQKDIDGKHRCKNPQSWCYSENKVILETDKACELFKMTWEKDFRKPELTMKIKGE